MMRYVIFRIPVHRLLTGGGWDDVWYRTDDVADAKMLVERDTHQVVSRAFPGLADTPDCYYQIVDLETGIIVLDTRTSHNA